MLGDIPYKDRASLPGFVKESSKKMKNLFEHKLISE